MKIAIAICLAFLGSVKGRADLGLLMLESTGIGAARYTAAGHSAVYLSNLCAESPVRLRFCRAGESGSVISKYSRFLEDRPYEWNVAPLRVYLYGVEDPARMPLYADNDVRQTLRERYRREYLNDVCFHPFCESPDGRWGDLSAATLTRDIYCFRLHTTPEQDLKILEYLNSDPNRTPYHAITQNCADFSSRVINFVFPGAAKPDRINDFFITSPKAIAKSFVHYGEQRPDLGLSVERYTQIAGPIRRSDDNRKGTEASFRVKKWLLPLLVFRSRELPLFMLAYGLTGRFDAESAYRKYASQKTALERYSDESKVDFKALTMEIDEKLDNTLVIGEVWADYRKQFTAVLHEALLDGVFAKESDVKQYFKVLERESRADPGSTGFLILRDRETRVGITPSTILEPESDRPTALRLMLAKINATLESKPKNRESLLEFRADWELMLRLRETEVAERPQGLSERGPLSSE